LVRKYIKVFVPEHQDTTFRAVLPGQKEMFHEMMGVLRDIFMLLEIKRVFLVCFQSHFRQE